MKLVSVKDGKLYPVFRVKGEEFKRCLNLMRLLEGSSFDHLGKQWSAKDTEKNREALRFYRFKFDEKIVEEYCEIPPTPYKDVDVSKLPKEMRPYQVDGVRFLEAVNGRGIIGDSPRCIDGDAIVTINRGGNGRKYKLSDVYKRFKGLDKLNHNYDRSIPTYIRGLKKNGVFGLLLVKDLISSGKKKVFSLATDDGKTLKATPDHLFYKRVDGVDTWTPLGQLQVGDYIMVNGQSVCPRCGATENLVTWKYAKFKGYCKSCVNRLKMLNAKNMQGARRISSWDGYVYLTGSQYWDHPRYNHNGIAEHIVVMEKHLGRGVNRWEEVHHMNHDRSDNRLANLKLLSRSEHKAIHEAEKRFGNFVHRSGTEVVMIPKYVQIVSICEGDIIDTYDVMVDQEEHNYVANGIVVHNCGKSIQALGYCMLHPEKRPVLVLCPANAKIGWEREIKKRTDDALSVVLYGCTSYKLPPEIEYIIINYDIIYDWYEYLLYLRPQVLIVDEMQAVANTHSNVFDKQTNRKKPVLRTQAFLALTQQIPHIIPLSGTPITRCPAQFFTVLHALRNDLFPNRKKFLNTFCDPKFDGFEWRYDGITNVQKLRSLLALCMIRRRKKDVFDNLPIEEKIIVPLEVDEKIYKAEAKEYEEWFKENTNATEEEIARRLNLMRSISYDAKRSQIIDWLEEFIGSGEKIVVFCWHRDVCEDLHRTFKGISVMVYGGMDVKKRQEMIDRFQEDGSIKIFVANIKACNTAISLSAADTVAFCELPFCPGDMTQAEERIFIPNDGKQRITHYYLVAGGTLDEARAISLQRKAKVLGAVLDGEEGGPIFGKDIKKALKGS